MIDTVLRLLRKTRNEADGLDIFSNLLFASTLESSLAVLDERRLARFAQEAFAFISKKVHRRHSINLRETDLIEGRKGEPVTVVEILNDDMPHVVDSVMAEIHARGLSPALVLHPIFKVKRYGSGGLTAVIGPGDRHWAAGDQESYVAVLLDGAAPAELRALVEALDAVLNDVRHVAADGEAMRARLAQAITACEGLPLGFSTGKVMPAAGEITEAAELLRWLGKGNFLLLGMRDYDFVGTEETAELWPSSAPPLGILRSPDVMVLRRGTSELQVTPEIRAYYAAATPLIITKASAMSRVRARTWLDYIGVKRYAQNGSLLGELRLVGLFTQRAYLQQVEAVPVLRLKARKVVEQSGFPPDSHNGRTLVDILEHLPRDELFQIDMAHLANWSLALLDLELRPRTRVLARLEPFKRYHSVLVFVPRDQYSSQIRERIGRYLADALGGRVAGFYPSITSSPLVRTQFIISIGDAEPREVPDAVLERDVTELLRTWGDRLEAALGTRAPQLIPVYRQAFSAGYTESFPVERAVEDIGRIERLSAERPVAIDFHHEADAAPDRVRAAVYRFGEPIPLSERVPLIESLGFRVIDERSYIVRPSLGDGPRDVVLHDMALATADGKPVDIAASNERLEACFLAVFHGHAENDPFNGLVLAAGLDWREASVFRAFAAYLRQILAPFGPRYVAETLLRHPDIAREIHELFRARFDPDQLHRPEMRAKAIADQKGRIEAALAGVASLEEDRVLRRLLNLVIATVRTNVFQSAAGGIAPGAPLAFKLDSHAVDGLPEPRPFREIFVYAPRVEGIHLRFAPIARGGIRWSDRPQDFRTEVLGLAKAQQVKNVVIVPSGAKGGFVLKHQPREATREETQAAGVAAYRSFIGALLSLTDDIRDGRITPPERVVRHDSDDPYLVVAADKGTATFSDYANEIAVGRGYWLGDAFASGGSAGYDHKRLGITARGAWESVKRHFREMDVDIATTPFSVVGVGDMSGDVFGNGMLLSGAIRLVAAFDHRDIFLDPNPDLAASLAERSRLFALPRSSWADYDKALISPGGGVFPRSAKSIPLSAEVRAMTGLDVDAIAPNELIHALLRAHVDLLWFGGIGTFVRASSETDELVGDRANDAIRITAAELGAKVVGEGANLGVTQRARIEAARRGIRLNADFIDNSAGVNTSDQEVNIKIALAPAVAARRLALPDRNALLASLAGEVAAAVLANNIQQSLAISLAQRTAKRDLPHYSRLARELEGRGLLVRRLEALPTGAEFTALAEAGQGLTRPEIALLMSWAKIALDRDLLASDVPDDAAFAGLLPEYFPPELRQPFAAEIAAHRLRREIVATRLTNAMINRGGPALIPRLNETASHTVADIARAFMGVRTIHGLPDLWAGLDALPAHVPGVLQLDLYGAVQDLLVAETARLLAALAGRRMDELVARYRPAAEEIARDARSILPPRARQRHEQETASLIASGLPDGLASRLAALPLTSEVMRFADEAARTGSGVGHAARVLLGVGDYLSLDELAARAAQLKPVDSFDAEAVAAALATLEAERTGIVERMLADRGQQGSDPAQWIAANAARVAAAKPRIDEVLAQPELTVSRLTVLADRLRGASVN